METWLIKPKSAATSGTGSCRDHNIQCCYWQWNYDIHDNVQRHLWLQSWHHNIDTGRAAKWWQGETNPFLKSHNALDKYPTMHPFVTEMCTHVLISVTKWCIVGYGTGASWDLWDWPTLESSNSYQCKCNHSFGDASSARGRPCWLCRPLPYVNLSYFCQYIWWIDVRENPLQIHRVYVHSRVYILGTGSANESWCDDVRSSLIGWAEIVPAVVTM